MLQYIKNKWADYNYFSSGSKIYAILSLIMIVIPLQILISEAITFAILIPLVMIFPFLLTLGPIFVPLIAGLVAFVISCTISVLIIKDIIPLFRLAKYLMFVPYLFTSPCYNFFNNIKLKLLHFCQRFSAAGRAERRRLAIIEENYYHPTNPVTLKLKKVFETEIGLLIVNTQHTSHDFIDPVTRSFINHPVQLANDTHGRFWERASLEYNDYKDANSQLLNPLTSAPYNLSDIIDARQAYRIKANEVITARRAEVITQVHTEMTSHIRNELKKNLLEAYKTDGMQNLVQLATRVHQLGSKVIVPLNGISSVISAASQDLLCRSEITLNEIFASYTPESYTVNDLYNLVAIRIKIDAIRGMQAAERRETTAKIDADFQSEISKLSLGRATTDAEQQASQAGAAGQSPPVTFQHQTSSSVANPLETQSLTPAQIRDARVGYFTSGLS